MITPQISDTTASTAQAGETTRAHTTRGSGVGFHDILSAMNPLQYLPVVGTIYRAATGDVIPESLRCAGSLLVSGLMGGPIGVITGVASLIFEKATGIDPEKIGQSLMARLGMTAPAEPAIAQSPSATPTANPPVKLGWTPSQLAAYGISADASGGAKLGELQGADVFNALELRELRSGLAAYAAAQPAAAPTLALGI